MRDNTRNLPAVSEGHNSPDPGHNSPDPGHNNPDQMPVYRQRQLAFLTYAQTLSLASAAEAVDCSISQVEEWSKLEEWDDQIKRSVAKRTEAFEDMAPTWMFDRFLKFNKTFDMNMEKSKDAETGLETLQYSQALANIHDKQMVLLDRPAQISDERSTKDVTDGMGIQVARQSMEVVEQALAIQAAKTDESEKQEGDS